MLNKLTYGFVLLIATFLLNGVAFADNSPTIDQVYAAARAGKLEDAQRMMDIVLREHPDSAKAHFVEAEILAKQGQMGKADTELHDAERLKPDLSFANPQALQDLKNRIAATHRVSQSSVGSFQTEPGNSFPWGMLFLGLGAIAIIAFIMRAVTSRNSVANYQPGGQNTSSAMPLQPYGGGMAPMAPTGGGLGSGIMGGLVTGAAVGAGMVAGEALAHHFMDGNHGAASSAAAPAADSWASSSNDMGGSDFGVADNSSWNDSSGIADSSSDIGGGDWG